MLDKLYLNYSLHILFLSVIIYADRYVEEKIKKKIFGLPTAFYHLKNYYYLKCFIHLN